jgi:hypothetical protein
MRMLAYGAPCDTKYDYLRMYESIAIEFMYQFSKAVVIMFRSQYFRVFNEA